MFGKLLDNKNGSENKNGLALVICEAKSISHLMIWTHVFQDNIAKTAEFFL